MKKGIRGHDVREKGLKNICACMRENNIGYVQLVLEKSIDDFAFGNFSAEYANLLNDDTGDIKIAVLGSYINPSNPDENGLKADIEKFKEKIKYASVLNPIVVGTETGIYKEGETCSEEAYQYLLGTVKELVAEGEKYGVNIGIEGVHCFVINSPQKMKRLIDDVDSDNLKVIFDPVNLLNADNYINQDEIIEEMFSLLSSRICAIHAKDFTVENGEFKYAKPTEGMLNYKLIREKMREYNLDIPVITEEINESDAVKALDKIEEM